MLEPQVSVIYAVLDSLLTQRTSKGRQIAEFFLDLPDRSTWDSYYEVVQKPRSLNGIKPRKEFADDIFKHKLDASGYKCVDDVFEDLRLVFDNALFFNEEDSAIYEDAATLKALLERQWTSHSSLGEPNFVAYVGEKLADTTTSSSRQPDGMLHVWNAPLQSEDTALLGAPENNWESLQPRDKQGDELVRKLDRSLPRWKGPGLEGWWSLDEAPAKDAYAMYREVVNKLRTHQDTQSESRLAEVLERVSESAVLPDLHFSTPISLALIESRMDLKGYPGAKDFDMDLNKLFEKARRWFEEGTTEYGQVLALQQLYQLLTSTQRRSVVSHSAGPASNISSIAAGPGNAKPIHSAASTSEDGVTTYRIQNKERAFIEEKTYKGITYKPGDYVHLMNPDDPAKPIIGQIFKVYVPDNATSAQCYITACWYFRPEQTYHPAQRMFWDREVFKTGHFADHAIEDIIEKIGCQFMTKHIRGRPKPPFWYPGWPLFVCDSRYNDRDRTFVRIKNWNSCIPDELRKTDFMPIQPFDRIVMPKKRASPFLRGVVGPGGLDEDTEGKRKSKRSKPVLVQQQASRGAEGGVFSSSRIPPTLPASSIGKPYHNFHPNEKMSKVERTMLCAAGGPASLGGNPVIEALPLTTTYAFDYEPRADELLWFSGPPVDVPTVLAFQPNHSLEYLAFVSLRGIKQVHSPSGGEVTNVVESDDESGNSSY